MVVGIEGACSLVEVLYGTFTAMASQSWNFCWVINFFMVLCNPMARHRKFMTLYHVFAWSMSLGAVVFTVVDKKYMYV